MIFMANGKEYTPWRRCLAWVGFITLALIAAGTVAYFTGNLTVSVILK